MKRLAPIIVVAALILSAGGLLLFTDDGRDPAPLATVDLTLPAFGAPSNGLDCFYQAIAAAEPDLFVDSTLFTVIRNQTDWRVLWDRVSDRGRRYPGSGCPDAGEPPSLDVDFEREMVILLVELQGSSGYSLDIDRIVAANDEWTVEATRTTPCCGGFAIMTYLHHAVVTKRFDGEVNLLITETVSGCPDRGRLYLLAFEDAPDELIRELVESLGGEVEHRYESPVAAQPIATAQAIYGKQPSYSLIVPAGEERAIVEELNASRYVDTAHWLCDKYPGSDDQRG